MGNILSNQRIHLLLIVIFVCFVYAGTLRNGFVIDDYNFVIQWPLIQEFRNFPLFFTTMNQPGYETGVYAPLKTLWHAINYQIWGQNAFGHHAVALLVHLTTTVLIYRITLLLSMDSLLAFLCALLFGLHPVHTEAVAFLTASVDMIGVMFLFFSFYFYLKACRDSTDVKTLPYGISLWFAFLAVFSYELTISLPGLILLYEICLKDIRRDVRNFLRRILPYFLVVLFYVVLKRIIMQPFAFGTYLQDSFYLTGLVMVKAWGKYIFLTIWPVRLCLDHILSRGIFSFAPGDFSIQAVKAQSLWQGPVLFSFMALTAILVFAFKMFKRHPFVTFGIAWFFVCLLPVCYFIPRDVFFFERYLYPASFGFCLIAAYGLSFLLRSQRRAGLINLRILGLVLVAAVLIFYAIRTTLRNREWRNNLTLFASTVRVNPQSSRMWLYLGDAFLGAGKNKEALACFDEALDVREDNVFAYLLKGIAFMRTGQMEESVAHLHKALLLKKDFAEAYLFLALGYRYLGEDKEAEENLKRFKKLYRQQGKIKELKKMIDTFWSVS